MMSEAKTAAATTGRAKAALPSPGFLEELVRDAGALAMSHFRRSALDVRRKADRSVVTEADHAVEAFLAARLRRAFPAAPIVGEENARDDLAAATDDPDTPCFIIDPIDGTSLFASGMPGWCISLGVFRGGLPWRGAIYLPVTDELYQVAEDGSARYTVGGRHHAPAALPTTPPAAKPSGDSVANGNDPSGKVAGDNVASATNEAPQDTGAGPAAEELRRAEAANGPASASSRGALISVLGEVSGGATLVLTTHAHKNLRNDWPGRCLVMGAVAVDCCLAARGVAAAVVGRPNIWDVAASAAILQAAGGECYYLDGSPIDWRVVLAHPAARAPQIMVFGAPAYRERVLTSIFPRKQYEHPAFPDRTTDWLPGGEPAQITHAPEAGTG